MADRKRPFFLFRQARRIPATQTPSPPRATTNSNPAARPTAQPVSRQPTTTTNPTSMTPSTTETQAPSPPPATPYSAPISTPTAESRTVGRQSTSTIDTTSPPPTTSQIVDKTHTTTLDKKKQPSTELQTVGQPTRTTLTSPTNETKTSSSSTATRSPSPSKPASPSRPTPQSKSPPQPSSPSHNSKTPSTPQRAPQPHSPSRSNSRQTPSSSPKGRQPNSPSKEESRQIAQEEPHLKAEVKYDSVDNEINSVDKTSFKHNEVKQIPSKSTELGNTTPTAQSIDKNIPTEELETPTSNGEDEALVELKAKKHDGTMDVKEVTQATKTEASEETKNEVNNFLNPKPGSEGPITEKSEIPSKPDDVHTEKQEVLGRKGILPISQLKNRSTNPCLHNKSAEKSGEQVSSNKDIRDNISTIVNQMGTGDPKNAIIDRILSIVTLAGENRGASMQMGFNLREGPVHINRGYKIKPDEGTETTTDGEGSSKGKQQFENAKAKEDQPTEAYVNNNVQGINNSIVVNASITEGSPGVHMVVTRVPKEPIPPSEEISPLETRKAGYNFSRAEKHTMVRRRCLRGLLMEKSDSDPENPEKPRRHGCRVGCKLKENVNSVDIP